MRSDHTGPVACSAWQRRRPASSGWQARGPARCCRCAAAAARGRPRGSAAGSESADGGTSGCCTAVGRGGAGAEPQAGASRVAKGAGAAAAGRHRPGQVRAMAASAARVLAWAAHLCTGAFERYRCSASGALLARAKPRCSAPSCHAFRCRRLTAGGRAYVLRCGVRGLLVEINPRLAELRGSALLK